ncbi:Uncharacterised protein [Chlamydia trachomatis]|nr:Uncharacterised protein [Chlamydia trachomatis]
MNKRITILLHATLLTALLLTLGSCQRLMEQLVKSPEPYIENIVEGHEQIYSIQAILRLAQRFDDPDNDISFEPYYYRAYDLDDSEEYPYPIYQEIEIRKNDEGSLTITSEREHFDVIKSDKFCYALELKYYDINNKLINHQFSRWYNLKGGKQNDAGGLDDPNSTLLVHQHFFTVDNYSLYGLPNLFPMTFSATDSSQDSLYINKFTFKRLGTQLVPATRTSTNNIFIPVGKEEAPLRYSYTMSEEAAKRYATNMVFETYTPKGSSDSYKLYQTFDSYDMSWKIVPQIFSYEYRDTDPVEEYLGTELEDQDDLGRIRTGHIVGLLRFQRKINDAGDLYQKDALGFKGILNFHEAHMQFQMGIRIAHIINDNESNKKNYRFPFGKYHLDPTAEGSGLQTMAPNKYNEIDREWSSYDISFPLPFRVIADATGDQETFIKDIKSVFQDADEHQLRRMFFDDTARYFSRKASLIF